MARSISPASRTSTGRNSTPNDGATAWIAPKGFATFTQDSRHAITLFACANLRVNKRRRLLCEVLHI
jgi:hypothetical protein